MMDPRQLGFLFSFAPVARFSSPPRARKRRDKRTCQERWNACREIAVLDLPADRIRDVCEDSTEAILTTIVHQAWIDASWCDRQQGAPMTGEYDRDKDRLERLSAREDAIDWYAGVIYSGDDIDIGDPERGTIVGWGDDDLLMTVDLIVGSLLDWSVPMLRHIVYERLRELSLIHSRLLDDSIHRAGVRLH